ncbi:hypothetical protein D9M71_620710 [compost metagenome]
MVPGAPSRQDPRAVHPLATHCDDDHRPRVRRPAGYGRRARAARLAVAVHCHWHPGDPADLACAALVAGRPAASEVDGPGGKRLAERRAEKGPGRVWPDPSRQSAARPQGQARPVVGAVLPAGDPEHLWPRLMVADPDQAVRRQRPGDRFRFRGAVHLRHRRPADHSAQFRPLE